MLKSHDRFYTANGRRLLLVVDDEIVNREMLSLILSEEFEVITAENGMEALQLMRQHANLLSLVLLDLMMPVMDGFELMNVIRAEEELRHIPIIVLTSDKSAEVRSLRLGASDFITKPYDVPEVVLARVQRTIELSEDTSIIQTTERDELSGLFNREFFYRYADQFDLHHPDLPMDAVTLDINHFHLVNELYGRDFGNQVLRKIGGRIRQIIEGTRAIAGRQEGDMFLLYAPNGTDYGTIYNAIMNDLSAEGWGTRIRLRIGVYPNVDREIEMERRFDRAKQAGDTLRNNFTLFVAYYDNSLHDKEFLSERLIDDMAGALEQGQFQVYYQPKYDITGETPVLRSAEALIRWKHPELGMVSPGVFIPLFEQNGLIQKLDRFVWREAAAQVSRWREKFGILTPVSVNVSRIDMYAPDFVQNFQDLMQRNGLSPSDYFLEITESAYAEDSAQLIQTVHDLRSLGFQVEMDDFGSGYSSLNMLADLPIDILKLDMRFIRNLHAGEKNVRMLQLMIDIAKYLGVPVVAEGVETAEQLEILKGFGCDMIQGYYFSKPVPPEEFEKFIAEKVNAC